MQPVHGTVLLILCDWLGALCLGFTNVYVHVQLRINNAYIKGILYVCTEYVYNSIRYAILLYIHTIHVFIIICVHIRMQKYTHKQR